ETTDLLIDATHPFAVRMKANAADAARIAGVPLLAVLRPPWQPVPGDRWIMVADFEAAAAALGASPPRVLLAIGQKDLAAFRAASWHCYVVRTVDPPEPTALPAGAAVIAARGPFRVEDERRLLEQLGIEVIVTKNSGGTATEAKL